MELSGILTVQALCVLSWSCGRGQAIVRTLHRGKVAKKRFRIRMVGVRL